MKNKSLVLSNTYVTKVQNLDALGQGQCTIDDNRAYISKTLPEELIECTIDEKKKGVYFGSLIAVQKSSPLRIAPECPHFNACSGCSYLHVNYDNELNFKKMSLTKNLGYLKAPNYELQVLASPQRFFYRNRIQLHYRLKPYPLIGYLNKNSIVPMINCLLPMQILKNYLDGFLPQWEKRLPADAPQVS